MSQASLFTWTPSYILWYDEVQPTYYSDIALLAVVVYEYFITVEDEVTHVWSETARRQNSRTSQILFGLTRYLTLLYAIIAAAADFMPGKYVILHVEMT
ncbi:hypothetical protein PHLGIDRAFT_114879 [Phlebiopsis gigantea 11061_1 CR5-6]|uniref:DUF6533 domain-containing protein n=1 Tax=Phlebiopsis gigantea (strain 11061_1 CR5-6) TaxID=745531 RepID=A0A0C3SF01_PHLG1|nr:hypothetical protein PHLGIDRAFT_114879 [Phlebiopsis gigantea 11061_1 CR5-6]